MIRNEENKAIKIVSQPPVFEIKTLEFCKGFFWEEQYTDPVQWECIDTSCKHLTEYSTESSTAWFQLSHTNNASVIQESI